MKSSVKTRILIIVLIVVIIIGVVLILRKMDTSSNKNNANNINNSTNAESTQDTENTNNVQGEETTAEEPKVEENVQVLDDGKKYNISNKLQEERTFEGLKITGIQLTAKGGITTLLATVQNPTDKATSSKNVKVKLLDAEGQKITELKGVIDPIQPNGSVQLNIAVTSDVANAYDLEIEKN